MTVVIAGAGPVGLMLAGELRLGGADVLVVERRQAPATESRATHLHARTMEVLDQRGLLGPLGTVRDDRFGHFAGLPLDLADLPSVHNGHWYVPQAHTEAVLESWARRLGAVIRRGHEVVDLVQAENHVDVVVAGSTVRASYLVGCDGAGSTVARLAGFDHTGREATVELLRADVAGIAVPDRRLRAYQHGVCTAARRADGTTRLMVHEYGAQPGRPPSLAAVWARVTGEDIAAGRPLWVDAFDDASRQATRYRNGRVLLAGDAAHQQPPVGGQALNVGLQDAVNLGWKLAAEVRGDAPAGLLDSYHDERHAVGARVAAYVAAQTQLIFGGDRTAPVRTILAELTEHDQVSAHLAGMVSGLDVRYPTPGDHPLLGARIPHWELGSGESTTSLLHPAKGVLLDLSSTGTPSELAAGWADQIRIVRAPGAMPDLDAVLLRPDGHVAWVGTDPRPALPRWFGAPKPITTGGRQ